MTGSIDQYEVVGTLGSGSSGNVKVAYDPEFERYVAIKEFSPMLVGDPYFLQRLRTDAEQLKRLDSPNCAAVYELIESPTRAWLVSEYVEGASLRRILDRAGFLSPEQALGVIKGAVNGLGYGHSLGLVHRDVKPANILLNREGLPKLTDFGQALFTPGPGAAGGIPAGTPAYMSPEQVTGGTIDYRSDIYSCGAVLYECLTGKKPYHAESALEIMRMHVSDPVPDPRRLNAALPEGVAEMVKRAMAKDPADRQPSAFQFLADLEQAAVAGYGEGWQGRASVRPLVSAIVAESGSPLFDRLPPPPTGGGPILATGGEWWRDWRVYAGGAAALVLIVGIGFAIGGGGHKSNPSGVAIASESPSPSPQQSASPDVTPSPTPTPSPSPSPSPSAKPSPSPTPSPPPPDVTVDRTSMAVWYEKCALTCSAALPGSAYSDPSTPLSVTCSTTHLKFFEQYSWADPGPGGKPVPLTIHWQGGYPSTPPAMATADSDPPYVSDTAQPGAQATHPASASIGYDDTGMSNKTGTAPGFIYFNITWTNPSTIPGSQGPSPSFYYKCT
ncbi:MAG TPA: serine/threonine-protein kinase [Candidatus Solibacter sp.]|nr:serine/threonine-protein kinase [Candidatus Solibacter sp.]